MLSCIFNEWAEMYVTKYMQSGKFKRMLLRLNLKILHQLYKDEGYKNVLGDCNE